MRNRLLQIIARTTMLGALTLAAGCGSDPAPDYQPQVSEEERQTGAEQHPQLLAEFGGAYSGPQADYVKRLGSRIATAAGLADQCTFTLVNSDVVNAFAVPGCYIYVTRGLMAIVGSEAEISSVLAHEIGHIVGHHSERQQSRSLWRALGVLAISLAGSEQLTRIAGEAAQFFGLRYSRSQEYEADELGIRYLREARYDPYAAAEMLGALGRHEAFMAETGGHDAARAIPEWARSHPLTERRIERARELARATGLADDDLPENAPAYLAALDGMLYGDDPEQGFVLGRRFVHPVMQIAFEAPEGFTLTNSPQAIYLNGPNDIRGEFGGGPLPSGGLEGYADLLARQLLGQTAGEIGRPRETRINGLRTLVNSATIHTDQGPVTLSFGVFDGGSQAYHFVMAAPPSNSSAASVDALIHSFRLVSPQEAATLRPRQIRIVEVTQGQTVAGLARGMASDHQVALLRMLNDLSSDQPVRPGDKIKLITVSR